MFGLFSEIEVMHVNLIFVLNV